MRLIVRCIVVALLLLLAVAPVAHAEDLEAAQQHFLAAKELSREGQHRRAVVAFEKAYVAAPRPNVLYNLGHEHRVLYEADGNREDAELAVGYLRSYLAALPEADDRVDLERVIADLERRAALPPGLPPKLPEPPQEAPIGAVAAPVAAVEPPAAPAAAPATTTASPSTAAPAGMLPPAQVTRTAEPAAPRPLYRRWWVWTAVAVVVAGGVAGAVAGATARPRDAVPPPSDLGSMTINF